MDGFSRREALVVIGAAGAMCAGIGGCQSVEQKSQEKPPQITSGTVTLGPASDFPAATVHQGFEDMYGIVVVNDSGMPVAVRPKCTHKGCLVKWTGEERQFVCPCHGSKFSMIGLPTHGPADRPLAAVVCGVTSDGRVTVDLTKLYGM